MNGQTSPFKQTESPMMKNKSSEQEEHSKLTGQYENNSTGKICSGNVNMKTIPQS